MACTGVLTPPNKKYPPKTGTPCPKTLSPQAPSPGSFTTLPLVLELFNHSSIGGKKENTTLIQELIISHNYQQMKKTN